MKLLLDVGNSSVSWAEHDECVYGNSGTLYYGDNCLIDQLDLELKAIEKPDVVLFTSVVNDEDNRQIGRWTDKRWNLEAWQAKAGKQFKGLSNSYHDYEQMGADRWLAMIAARDEFRGALCVVDCGTAITIDLVKPSGWHYGGFILPGIGLMQHALITGTERVTAGSNMEPSLQPANNTGQAITHGTCLAAVGAIEHAIADFQASVTQHKMQYVVTGGGAAQLQALLKIPFVLRPHLVLDGLVKLYEASG